MKARGCLLALAILAAAGCRDGAAAPGAVSAFLHSPNGSEGAAAVTILAEGVADVSPLGGTEVHWRTDRDITRVILIHPGGGDLEFEVALLDVTTPMFVQVVEVAGPDDELRASVAGYRVELAR